MAVHCPTGVLTDLTPAEAVALLSALVFQERTDAAPAPGALPPALEDARDLSVQVAAPGQPPAATCPWEQMLHCCSQGFVGCIGLIC